MDAWLAYAPVKNNPEDAAKVHLLLKNYKNYVESQLGIHLSVLLGCAIATCSN